MARIAVKFPHIFRGTIFDTFPYLLPNLVTALTAVIALICAILFLFDPVIDPRKKMKPRNLSLVIQNPGAMMSTFSYGVLGGTFTMFDELLPLWLTSQFVVGGLNFGTTLTGLVNGITGVGNLLVLLLLCKLTLFSRNKCSICNLNSNDSLFSSFRCSYSSKTW